MDDLVPEEFDDLIELVAVAGVAADTVSVVVFFIIKGDVRNGVGIVFELAVKTPADAFVELAMVEAHEVALDVEFDDEGGTSVILRCATDMGGKALLAEESAFADAAGVRVDDEAAVPPVGADVIEEMVNDAVAEWGGNDFADDWIADDEGNAAAGFITALDDAVAEENEIFHVV